MTATLMIIPVTIAALLHYLIVGRYRSIFNVDGIFVISMWIMSVGTLWILEDPGNETPGYAQVITAPFLIYVATSIIAFLYRRRKGGDYQRIGRLEEIVPTNVAGTPFLLALFCLSALISGIYFATIGYNVFALGLQGLTQGGTHDYTTLRLNTYAAERYLFPGYVNQFKNIILPTLAVLWIHYANTNRHRSSLIATVILTSVSVLALLGTGQRAAFILFLLAVVIFTYQLNPRRFWPRSLRLGLVALPFMLLSTFLLGRSSAALTNANSDSQRIVVLFGEIAKRFMYDNQWSGLMAFKYVQDQPIQWGREWGQSLMGVLPSNSGSTLAKDVFKFLYGSDRGTAPISTWGSVYYNFDWFGLIILPVLLATAWGIVSELQSRSPRQNSLEVLSASGFAAVAGSWVAGGPEQLLNAGAVTFCILWWIGHRLRMRETRGAMDPVSRRAMPGRAIKS